MAKLDTQMEFVSRFDKQKGGNLIGIPSTPAQSSITSQTDPLRLLERFPIFTWSKWYIHFFIDRCEYAQSISNCSYHTSIVPVPWMPMLMR